MTTSLAGYRGQWPILPGNFARPSAARKQTRESDWSYNVKTSQLGIGDSGEGAGSPPPRLHAQNSGSGTVRRDGSGAVFRQGAHVHGGPSQLGQHQLFQQTKCAVSAKHTSSNIRGEGRRDLQTLSFAPRRLTTKGPEAVVIEGPAAPGVVHTPSPPTTKPPHPVLFTGRRRLGSGYRPARVRRDLRLAKSSIGSPAKRVPRVNNAYSFATRYRLAGSPHRGFHSSSSSPRAPQKHDLQVAEDGTAG